MPVHHFLLALAALTTLSACAVATPFEGPETPSNAAGPAVVIVTEATLKPDGALRDAFFDQVDAVEASLSAEPGFLGLSKRVELLGDRTWTMSAWTAEGAAALFVYGSAHQTAIDRAYDAVAAERFARFALDRATFPPSWDDALAALDAQGPPKQRTD
ncbi:MAG: hypothetical protein AAF360_10470 [Pseudomonadota bacterium]